MSPNPDYSGELEPDVSCFLIPPVGSDRKWYI